MANRKLQGEIDRVMKKVDEGVQIFNQTWDKVYSATTSAQKEKYEGDLKKEIKKLQRLRDQIKTWQGDSSIKDKTKLDATRKLIEEKMEKFKICEKETKTKAFSKEGLAQDRTDPRQKLKEEINDWVKDAITKLKEQCEEMEAEIESLHSGKRKKRSEENPRVSELKDHIARHEHHVEMLERVLRSVYNDAVELDEAVELKDSVDYYIESNQEPDFYEDEEMYDALNLDALPTPAPTSARKPAKHTRADDDDAHHTTPSNSSDRGSARKGSTSSPKTHGSASKGGRGRGHARTVSPKTDPKPSTSSAGKHSPAPHSGSAGRDALSPRVYPGGPLMSSVVKTGSAAAAAAAKHATDPLPPASAATPPPAADPTVRQIFRATPGPAELPNPALAQHHAHVHPAQKRWNGVVAGPARDAASPAPGPRAAPRAPPAAGGTYPQPPPPPPVSAASAAPAAPPGSAAGDARRQAGAAAAGAGEVAAQQTAIDRAFLAMPENGAPAGAAAGAAGGGGSAAGAGGAGVPVGLAPRNPANVPASFPHVAAAVFEKPNIFLKFDPDTLFFIFYYQQGTYQQYLAAKELKRQGWRFHKKYLTWFQRHDEPKVCNDEYENGTFIYFDYANVVYQGQGTGWCQRIKSEFVFEYRYLEDEMV